MKIFLIPMYEAYTLSAVKCIFYQRDYTFSELKELFLYMNYEYMFLKTLSRSRVNAKPMCIGQYSLLNLSVYIISTNRL